MYLLFPLFCASEGSKCVWKESNISFEENEKLCSFITAETKSLWVFRWAIFGKQNLRFELILGGLGSLDFMNFLDLFWVEFI